MPEEETRPAMIRRYPVRPDWKTLSYVRNKREGSDPES